MLNYLLAAGVVTYAASFPFALWLVVEAHRVRRADRRDGAI